MEKESQAAEQKQGVQICQDIIVYFCSSKETLVDLEDPKC